MRKLTARWIGRVALASLDEIQLPKALECLSL
jgi:hypothetical protein